MSSLPTPENMNELPLQEDTTGWKSYIGDVLLFIRDMFTIFIIVILVRTFLIQPFQISGKSMAPGFFDKEFIILDRFSYLKSPDPTYVLQKSTESGIAAMYQNIGESFSRWLFAKVPVHVGDPERGDVIVMRPHTINGKEYFIKRVIGMPGDQVKFYEGRVAIKTPESDEFVELDESAYLSWENLNRTFLPNYKEQTYTVPSGSYFMMGDNRNHSTDSRACFFRCETALKNREFLKRDDVVGKVLLSVGCPVWVNILSGGKICSDPSPLRLFDLPKTHIYTELQ